MIERRLLSNVISLSTLQILNYILPFLSIPFIVNIIGLEKFGSISLATSLVMLMNVICDFGFNLSGTRNVSINRGSNDKINEIFCSIILIKTVLLLFNLILLFLIVIFLFPESDDSIIFYISFLNVVGLVIQPLWLYQGLEMMKHLAFFNAIPKILFTILIFLMLNSENDYYLVPLFWGLGYLFSGLVSLSYIYKKQNLSFRFLSWQKYKHEIIDGKEIFISSISVSLYTHLVIIILGLQADEKSVGIYSAFEKIINALKGLFTPVSQSLYPILSIKFKNDINEGFKTIRKINRHLMPIIFMGCFFLFIFSELFITKIFNKELLSNIEIYQVLIFTPFIVSLSNVYGTLVMLNTGMDKLFRSILSLMAICNIFQTIVATYLFGAFGAAISVLLTELMVTLLFMFFVYLRFGKISL